MGKCPPTFGEKLSAQALEERHLNFYLVPIRFGCQCSDAKIILTIASFVVGKLDMDDDEGGWIVT